MTADSAQRGGPATQMPPPDETGQPMPPGDATRTGETGRAMPPGDETAAMPPEAGAGQFAEYGRPDDAGRGAAPTAAGESELAADDLAAGDLGRGGHAEAGPGAGAAPAQSPASLVQEWHEIQVMFVDNPRASVQQAAALGETAVARLIDAVRQQQAMLPAASAAADGGDNTEQLRAALQQYRAFCQDVDGLGRQLADRGRQASAERSG
jgi:hypothetical protein